MKNRLMLPVAMGGFAGFLNALMCLVKFPAVIPGADDAFRWHILLAGFIHGSILTLFALRAAQILSKKGLPVRLSGALGAGYAAGWISYIPLRLSINSNQTAQEFLSALWWPVNSGISPDILWSPWMAFGAVVTFYTLVLIRLKNHHQTASAHLMGAVLSGIVGSAWWWNSFERPYFCLLHGALWGIFVGRGVWKSKACLE